MLTLNLIDSGGIFVKRNKKQGRTQLYNSSNKAREIILLLFSRSNWSQSEITLREADERRASILSWELDGA